MRSISSLRNRISPALAKGSDYRESYYPRPAANPYALNNQKTRDASRPRGDNGNVCRHRSS